MNNLNKRELAILNALIDSIVDHDIGSNSFRLADVTASFNSFPPRTLVELLGGQDHLILSALKAKVRSRLTSRKVTTADGESYREFMGTDRGPNAIWRRFPDMDATNANNLALLRDKQAKELAADVPVFVEIANQLRGTNDVVSDVVAFAEVMVAMSQV